MSKNVVMKKTNKKKIILSLYVKNIFVEYELNVFHFLIPEEGSV